MNYMRDYFPPIVKVVPALMGFDVLKDGEVIATVREEDRAKELAFSIVRSHMRKVGSL